MSNVVIVAIPDENDRVWKVSSEKIPHLTLLFLGDESKVSNLDQIMQFVEHAADTTLKRFYMTVDRRGELGADQADVLFFKKGRYDFKAIRDFRATLLQDNNIRTAYDSATQFEGPWQPHLTLGYPATPAKPGPNENDTFYDVSFNKIAVWTGDFAGPDFLLKDYWDEIDELDMPLDVAMSGMNQARVAAGLEAVGHSGVKGMRWGVRTDGEGRNRFNPEGHSLKEDLALGLILPAPFNLPAAVRLGKRYGAHVNAKTAEKQGAKADKGWQKGLESAKKGVEVHNKAADEINKKLPAFNSDKRWQDKDGKDIDLTSNSTKMNEYNRAFEKEVMNPSYANAAIAVHGASSPTGRYKFEIKDASTGLMKVTDTTKMVHAATDDFDVEITFTLLRDVTGGVVGFEWPKAAMVSDTAATHGEAFVDTLMHFGTKGMRWGVRKAPPSAVAPTAASRVPHGDSRKTKIDVQGGENHPAHEDAIKVAEARVKLKKSGLAALSNQELRDVANRIQLEGQVAVLTSHKGKRFVTQQLQNEGQNLARQGVKKGARKAAIKVGAAALI